MNLYVDLSLDGSKWCALVGENIQEGVAGWGDTPYKALENLAIELAKVDFQF